MPVVLDEELEPVPVPLAELLPVAGLELGLVELELLPMLPVLLDGLVLELLLVLGVVVSVVELDDDEAGGVGGVLVVLLLLLVPAGGDTTVVLSLRSHPARPATSAMAKALDINILDFMGNSFRYAIGTKTERRRPPFPGRDARKFDATTVPPEAAVLQGNGWAASTRPRVLDEKTSADLKSLPCHFVGR